MPESYLHKMAKELLYSEIEENGGFEYKLNDGYVGLESLISRDDYRGECVLMEFPTKEGMYPDEFGCCSEPAEGECKFCKWFLNCAFDHIYDGVKEHGDSCGGYVWDTWVYSCRCPGVPGFRFKTVDNKCKCSQCDFFNFSGCVVHDIAVFWKGNVRWAIEIINKHTPDWNTIYAYMPYKIFFVNAEDVLKRVDKTPVYVTKIVYTSDIK